MFQTNPHLPKSVRTHDLPSDRAGFLAIALATAFLPIVAGIGASMDYAAASSTRSAIVAIADAAAAKGVEASTLQRAGETGDRDRERAITSVVMTNLFERLGGNPSLHELVRGTSVATQIEGGSVTTRVCVRAATRTMMMTVFGVPRLETESCGRAVGPLAG